VNGSTILTVGNLFMQKEGPPVAVTNSIVTPSQPITAAAAAMPAPKSQPLWRFALVGLGPLTALGIFALLVAFFQHTG
jgi:hypothetical protein